MEINFKFNLLNENDKIDYQIFKQALEMFSVLTEMESELRKWRKYKELSEEESNIIEAIESKFYELMDDHFINLDI